MQTGRRRQTYKETMWGHLAEHKVSALGIPSNGIWKINRVEYPHILPFEHQELNILEPYRTEFWEWFPKQEIKLHSDFHHLSSSQAMCFNLFFPFIAESKKYMQTLSQVFAANGVIQNTQFEVVLNDHEATNFDFCITADSRMLFEVKLTEDVFGGATQDESHLSKFERVYLPTIAGKFKPEFCSSRVFLQNYQIMRNVWSLEPDTADKLVFLVPKANMSLARGLAFLDSCVSNGYRPRVSVLFLEDVLQAIEPNIPAGAAKMREHFSLFRLKYIPESLPCHPSPKSAAW
jgi:hypothetical protein